MPNYLVSCDGCGKPVVVTNPQAFICSNCNYDECTIVEAPMYKGKIEPIIGGEVADFIQDLFENGPDKVQE